MENALIVPKVFEHETFGKLRTVNYYGTPLFCGIDSAKALGFQDTDKAIRNHVDDRDKILLTQADLDKMASERKAAGMAGLDFLTIDSPRGMIFINESGLNSLILDSKLPQAKEVRHWITSEVMPSIAHTGNYISNHPSVDQTKAYYVPGFENTMAVSTVIDSETWMNVKTAEILVKAARLVSRRDCEKLIAKASVLLTGEDLITDDNSKLVVRV